MGLLLPHTGQMARSKRPKKAAAKREPKQPAPRTIQDARAIGIEGLVRAANGGNSKLAFQASAILAKLRPAGLESETGNGGGAARSGKTILAWKLAPAPEANTESSGNASRSKPDSSEPSSRSLAILNTVTA